MGILEQLQPRRWNMAQPGGDAAFSYPESEAAWKARYNWLWSAYHNEPYTAGDITALGLFKALDADGDKIASTRRLTRDLQHIVETDVRAMAAHRLSLEPAARSGGNEARVAAGQRVWRRSRWPAKKAAAARLTAGLGDVMLEAQRSEGGGPARIVAHDPRFVELEYDEAGIELVQAWITVPFFDGPSADPNRAIRVQRRHLTRDTITTTEADPHAGPGGVRIDSMSGAHGLGVVPLEHVPYTEFGPPGPATPLSQCWPPLTRT
jgi:hypothetical protein